MKKHYVLSKTPKIAFASSVYICTRMYMYMYEPVCVCVWYPFYVCTHVRACVRVCRVTLGICCVGEPAVCVDNSQ